EERIPGTGCKDYNAALFEVSYCPAAYKRLGNLLHFNGAHYSSEGFLIFQCVLESDRVEHRRQHTHVIGGSAIHSLCRQRQSAKDISASDHDGHFDAKMMHAIHFLGDSGDGCRIDPVTLITHQSFAGKLQQYSFVYWLA